MSEPDQGAHHGHHHGGIVHAVGDLPDDESELGWFKLKAAVVIFGIAMLGGLMPAKLRNYRNKETFLSLGNAFAGGIFLCAGFTHMLGEAIEGFEHMLISYETPLLYCMGGILITLFVEKVALPLYLDSRDRRALKLADSDSELPTVKRRSAGGGGASLSHGHGHGHGGGGGVDHDHDHGALIADASVDQAELLLSVYILTVLLSMHSLIEGMALGVELFVDNGWLVLTAIGAHKSFAAFALGLSLVKADTANATLFKVMLVFSSMTPAGIAAGYLFSINMHDDSPMSAAVQAVAAGSFIYVALAEVLLPEFGNGRDTSLKFLLVIAGVFIMLNL